MVCGQDLFKCHPLLTQGIYHLNNKQKPQEYIHLNTKKDLLLG